ncbi:phage tail tape measure protein [Leuconostoc lactis]|uniref:phage tail tape measure protein n=1 Tax=Leuconostoc lactis TaxID=1246 RepID=UPI0022E56FDB|nr:phage tail tape measure protein [Leuconostoc lactis]
MADKKIVRTLAMNLTLDTDQAKQGLKELTQAVKDSNNEAKILEAQYKSAGDAVSASKAKYEGLTATVDAQKQKVDALKQALESNNTSTEAGRKNQEFLTTELAKAERQYTSYQGQLEKATQSYKYQESGLAELNKELKHSNDMTEARARALEAEGKSEEAEKVRLEGLKNSHVNLSKQLKIQQDELKDLADAGDKGSEAYKRQELRVAQMGAKVSEASRAITKFTEKNKDVGESAKGFNKVNGEVGKMPGIFSAALAGATALAAGMGAFVSKVADTNSQIGGIQARTTQTYEQSKASYKAVNDLYAKGYGESLDELQETYVRVQQLNPKDSIADLTEKTKLASTYAKQSGADIQEVLAGASKATTNLGISYEDYFDLMTTASKKGLDTQGALSDEMGEYSQVLGQMGFSAKDAFGLLQNGIESGAYNTDKLLDFTKEFGISLTDGRMADNIGAFSKNTKQMFNGFRQGKVTSAEMLKAVTGDLSGMTDKQKEATLASNLWSALGEDNALKVVESMGKTNDSFDQVKGTAKATADQLKSSNPFDLAKRGAEAFTSSLTLNDDQIKKLKKSFEPLGKALKQLFDSFMKNLPKMIEALTPVIDFTAKHLPELITGLGILAGLWGTTKIIGFGKAVAGAGKDVTDLAKKASGLIIKPKVDGGPAKRELGIISKIVVGIGKGVWWTAKLAAKAVLKTLEQIGNVVIGIGKGLAWTAKLAWTGVKKAFGLIKIGAIAVGKGMKWTAGVATKGAQLALKGLLATAKVTGNGIKLAFNFMKANPLILLVTAITAVVVAFAELYKHNKKFRDFVNGIVSAAADFFKGIGKWFGQAWDTISKFFSQVLNFVKKDWKEILLLIVNPFAGAFALIYKHNDNFRKSINNLVKSVVGFFKELWRNVTDIFGNIADFISSTLSGIGKFWDKTWNMIFGTARNIWNYISKLVHDSISGISDVIGNVLGGIGNVWRGTWQGLSDFFGGIWRSIKGYASDGINGVLNVINAGVDAIDSVWKFFTGHETSIHHLQPVKFAQGGVVTQRLAMVNDGDGPDWKELIQLPNGDMKMSQKRNAVMPLPVGTRIYNGAETKAIMNYAGIEKYANGGVVGGAIDWAKGALSNVGSWIGDKFDAIDSFLKNPLNAVMGLIQKATSGLIGGLGNFGQLASGTLDKLLSPISDWFTKGLKKVQEEGQGAPAGAGVQRWAEQVKSALAANGLSTSEAMVQKVLRQIQTESGGNERAVQGNIGDVNNASGDLAKGLMQVISATFNAFKFPGHNNPFNGYDSLLAGLNYAKNRYGSNLSFLGQGHGYANGGLITQHQIAEIGEGNKPEMIIPLDGMKSSRGFELLGKTAVAMAARDGKAIQGVSDGSEVTQLLSQNNQLLGVVTQILGAILSETEKGNEPLSALSINRLSRLFTSSTVRSTN